MNTAKRVRMADVAKLADVSVSTVSHVLNSTRFVADETRSRVEEAAASLGYLLRRRESPVGPTIGLAITGASNPYLAELILGVESEARRAGYAMLFCDTHDQPKTERDSVALLLSRRVDGVILAPTDSSDQLTLPMLNRQHTPFVLVDRFVKDVDCDQVGTESETAACQLVEHLIKRGHTDIGMLVGLRGLSTSAERLAGYRRAHRVNGLPIHPELLRDGESSVAGGRRATLQLIRAGKMTALFSGNNAMTIGALLALREEGMVIGKDVALVAFDDLEWGEAMPSPLTAAAQPFHAMGARAVQLLIRRLNDPLATRKILRLPASIEHRSSCGCDTP
jgi:LacI family transcriptional regulator, galactose operon repressor